jgi:hypothetical protein
MEDICIICADHLRYTAYGSCGHKDTCSKCVSRLRTVLNDQRCAYCQQALPCVYVTRFMGDYTQSVSAEGFAQLEVGRIRILEPLEPQPGGACSALSREAPRSALRSASGQADAAPRPALSAAAASAAERPPCRPPPQARAKSGELSYLPSCQAYFDDTEHYTQIARLCSFTHPRARDDAGGAAGAAAAALSPGSAPPGKTFASLRQLKEFLLRRHQLQFCDICLEGRKARRARRPPAARIVRHPAGRRRRLACSRRCQAHRAALAPLYLSPPSSRRSLCASSSCTAARSWSATSARATPPARWPTPRLRGTPSAASAGPGTLATRSSTRTCTPATSSALSAGGRRQTSTSTTGTTPSWRVSARGWKEGGGFWRHGRWRGCRGGRRGGRRTAQRHPLAAQRARRRLAQAPGTPTLPAPPRRPLPPGPLPVPPPRVPGGQVCGLPQRAGPQGAHREGARAVAQQGGATSGAHRAGHHQRETQEGGAAGGCRGSLRALAGCCDYCMAHGWCWEEPW